MCLKKTLDEDFTTGEEKERRKDKCKGTGEGEVDTFRELQTLCIFFNMYAYIKIGPHLYIAEAFSSSQNSITGDF